MRFPEASFGQSGMQLTLLRWVMGVGIVARQTAIAPTNPKKINGGVSAPGKSRDDVQVMPKKDVTRPTAAVAPASPCCGL